MRVGRDTTSETGKMAKGVMGKTVRVLLGRVIGRACFGRAGRFMRRIPLFVALSLSPFPFFPVTPIFAQEVVDKMVATVNAGVIPKCGEVCLITYSDLLWQLALQPNTPLDNPSSADLNYALHLLIDQRLILQEAEKLPTIEPTLKEVEDARNELVKEFLLKASLSRPEFEQRLRKVGLTALKLDQILEQRLKIEKYLDFRFRNFVVTTQKEIADYYRDIYVPRLTSRGRDQIVPSLEQARDEIENILKEAKIESDTDAFLDNARERAEIVTLSPV
jgi:hypothetical protein